MSLAAREDYSFIEPLQLTLTLRSGREVALTAASVGQLAAMLRVLTPVLGKLAELPQDLLQRLELGLPSVEDLVHLTSLLAEDMGVLLKVCEVATRLPQAEIEALQFDEAAAVFATAVHVNADFFARARPTLRAAVGRLGAIKPAAAEGSLPTPPASTTPGPSASTS